LTAGHSGNSPAALQRAARTLFDEIRAWWDKIRNFLTDLIKRLKKYADNIIDSLTNFVTKVVGYGIQGVVKAIRAIRGAWEFVLGGRLGSHWLPFARTQTNSPPS